MGKHLDIRWSTTRRRKFGNAASHTEKGRFRVDAAGFCQNITLFTFSLSNFSMLQTCYKRTSIVMSLFATRGHIVPKQKRFLVYYWTWHFETLVLSRLGFGHGLWMGVQLLLVTFGNNF